MSELTLVVTGTLKQIQDSGVSLLEHLKEMWPEGVTANMAPHILIYKDEASVEKWKAGPDARADARDTCIVMTAQRGPENDSLGAPQLQMLVTLEDSDSADVQNVVKFVDGLGLPVERKVDHLLPAPSSFTSAFGPSPIARA